MMFGLYLVFHLISASAECATPAWDQFPDKPLSGELKKIFFERLKTTPIIFSAIVSGAEHKLDDLLAKKSTDYTFTVAITRKYKGSEVLTQPIYNFNYEWVLRKPPVTTPQPNDEWIFFVKSVKKNLAEPVGVDCGNLGFKTNHKALMSAFKEFMNR